MNYAYLLTGGNMGNPAEELDRAAQLIARRCGTIVDRSSIYRTAPWGKIDQPDFLNQALVVETRLDAHRLLKEILAIEVEMGRNRGEKFGPRVIDIDIIFFNHQIIDDENLTLPHPEMSRRRFVLEPLNEIIPAYIHPVFYRTVQQLLGECPDTSAVNKIELQK